MDAKVFILLPINRPPIFPDVIIWSDSKDDARNRAWIIMILPDIPENVGRNEPHIPHPAEEFYRDPNRVDCNELNMKILHPRPLITNNGNSLGIQFNGQNYALEKNQPQILQENFNE